MRPLSAGPHLLLLFSRFLCGSDFELQILTWIGFSIVQFANRNSLLTRNPIYLQLIFLVRVEQTPTNCCGLAPRRDAPSALNWESDRSVREPTLTASSLAAKRRAECAQTVLVFLFWHKQASEPSTLTDCCCCCCCCKRRVLIDGEARAEYASLGL